MGKTNFDIVDAIFVGDVNTYVADGAIAVTDKIALLDGTNATVAATLGDGEEGQVIDIIAINVTNAVTITPTNFANGTTITCGAAYYGARLLFDGTNWILLGSNGTVS